MNRIDTEIIIDIGTISLRRAVYDDADEETLLMERETTRKALLGALHSLLGKNIELSWPENATMQQFVNEGRKSTYTDTCYDITVEER